MKKIQMFILMAITAVFLCSCTKEDMGKRGKDIDYTVVSETDIPMELKTSIDKNKINPFELTYTDGEFMYLAVGYGEQESGGFSIQVVALHEQGDKILFSTNLIGANGTKDQENKVVKKKVTTPYIVVKMEEMDKEVIYK